MTAQALEFLGKKCGVIGTLGSGLASNFRRSPLTTPDAVSLHGELAELLESGAQHLCLEVSSHSLDQSRVQGVHFETVVFTNLTQDHLDYHRTMDHYRASKLKLFVESNPTSAVINIDDEFGRYMLGKTAAEREITFGTTSSMVRLNDCTVKDYGLEMQISVDGRMIEINSNLLGHFNAINLTAVAAILYAMEFEAGEIELALSSVQPITGRMQTVQGNASQPNVIVDYAHTPDGLETVLKSLQQMSYARITCVFGCGGDRDSEKRPLMGEIAERLSDRVILTDDNPRGESPQKIVKQIISGMTTIPEVIHDRREAIQTAVHGSGTEDIVLIAGKGHEDIQIFHSTTVQFSDVRVASEVLRELK